MKILFVAMANSVHVARWIKQLHGQEWDLHLFPSEDLPTYTFHDALDGVTVHTSLYGGKMPQQNLKRTGLPLPPLPKSVRIHSETGLRKLIRNYRQGYWHRKLAHLIDELQPDIIHIIEFQHAGYLLLEALPFIKQPLPKIILTNWGNDTYLFGQLDSHVERIKTLLALADYYDCECERDVQTAKDLGFTGKTWPVFANTGGHQLDQMQTLRTPGPVSQRRVIMLKGYQHWQGRSLFALKGLEMIADQLHDYTLAVFSVSNDVEIAVRLFQKRTGLKVEFLPHIAHEDMMRQFGKSRIYLCSNITDGLNTAFGEAITMGAFPVISGTACVDEWLTDGETGIIIHDPEDPREIANAVLRAITDDALVDNAAERNWQIVQERLDYDKIQRMTIELYQSVYAEVRK